MQKDPLSQGDIPIIHHQHYSDIKSESSMTDSESFLDTKNNYFPKFRFLVACCQVQPDLEEIKLYIESKQWKIEDWENIFSLASRHGILPLLYKTLRQLDTSLKLSVTSSESYFPNLLTNLKTRYMNISQQNMLMSAELIRIMKLFKENKIPALAFKGPTLAQMAYNDITLRQYSDLDILIYKKDIKNIFFVMASAGYNTVLPKQLLNDPSCMDIMTDFLFINKQNKIIVEIHWQLMEENFQMNIKTEQLINMKTDVSINNSLVRTIHPEIMIVYLAMHGAKHGWERLGWLCDIDYLIRTNEKKINWDTALKLAKDTGSFNALLSTLYASKELFSTPIPDTISYYLNNTKISVLGNLTIKMTSELMHKDGIKRKLLLQDYRYMIIDKRLPQWYYNLKSLFTLSYLDCADIRLPRLLKFLYYPLRIKRLIQKNIL
jgi:hypothetical protein